MPKNYSTFNGKNNKKQSVAVHADFQYNEYSFIFYRMVFMEGRQDLEEIAALETNLIIYCVYVLNNLEAVVTEDVVASQFPPEISEPLNNIKQLLFVEKFPEILNLLKIKDNDIRKLLIEAIPPIYFSALEESQQELTHRAELFKQKLSMFFQEAMTAYHSASIATPRNR